ncbi:hypothetical protein M0G43_08575 [Subsaxibacter sp. CAU 1640]|uniref:hypothetical protein n=1 Tax=Subsaxibacter sp. CAU 1640 TaxID=2933271 RepID=UPI002005A908|nr:hypothetical protein [Subsaxibacter sp. CAU 1640]MCK7590625.1 hypothetical protein [Subsaxibacter sp. CAU 1640]
MKIYNSINGSWNSSTTTETSLSTSLKPDAIESKWAEIHRHYRHRYPELTGHDVNYYPGEFDQVLKRIAKRTFRNVQEVSDEIMHMKPSRSSQLL